MRARSAIDAAVRALFGSPGNSAMTVVMLALFWLAVPPFVRWAFANAAAPIARLTGPAGLLSGSASRCSSMGVTHSPSAGA